MDIQFEIISDYYGKAQERHRRKTKYRFYMLLHFTQTMMRNMEQKYTQL